MSNLNKVMLIGRLGRDPEVRYTKSGSAVANIRMATTDFWKDRDGNRQERTEWHTVVAWGRLADLAQNYLKKGRLIYVEGRLQTRDWTDNQNVKRYATEIVANNIQFLERQDAAAARQERPEAPPQAGVERGAAPYPEEAGEPTEEGAYLEDDIPF
jgi:single-strand DNA-binding protein